jgi:hypothetical protein
MEKSLDLFETVPDPHDLVIQVFPIIDYAMRGMCAKPYPGHPKGCPKFNAGYPECPPDAMRFYSYFNIDDRVYAIVNEFNLEAQVRKMRTSHPDWSERQARNCYYWQKGARAELRRKIGIVLSNRDFKGYDFTMVPEAMGVDITWTLEKAGIILEWPPVNIVRQVALLGVPINRRINTTEPDNCIITCPPGMGER